MGEESQIGEELLPASLRGSLFRCLWFKQQTVTIFFDSWSCVELVGCYINYITHFDIWPPWRVGLPWKEPRAKKLLPLAIQAAAWVKSRKDLDQETSRRWSGGSWTIDRFPWCFLRFCWNIWTSGLSKADGFNNDWIKMAHAIWISSVIPSILQPKRGNNTKSFNMPRMPRCFFTK